MNENKDPFMVVLFELQMLKMFIMHGGPSALSVSSAFDMDEVRQFLDKKVRDHELVFSGGQYKLPSRQ